VSLKPILARLADGARLTEAEAEEAFGIIMAGEATPAQIAGMLMAMRVRGETVAEMTGAVRAMRARMVAIEAPPGAMDIVGTGGDAAGTLNISTTTAMVVAGCGVPVAKHGNRALSSRSGAADAISALGISLDMPMERLPEVLRDAGMVFLMAPRHHASMRHAAGPRMELGTRTIFNLLGPLCNPASVRRQLVGVSHPSLIATYAKAITLLDADDVMVVAGDEPMDELSVSGPSSVARIGSASPTNPDISRLTAADAGLSDHPREALKGGDAAYNAAALRRLLMSETETAQDRAYRDAVLFNSAAALMVAGHADDWQSGVEEATEAIDKGLAKALLDCWIAWK
jgi:anthranilate phosphoribosyltransferase